MAAWHARWLAAASCSGCSSLLGPAGTSTSAAPRCGDPQGVVLIVGAHRNAPAPSLDQRLACQVTGAIRAGKPVLLVVASGQPQLLTPQLQSVSGGTLAEQRSPRASRRAAHPGCDRCRTAGFSRRRRSGGAGCRGRRGAQRRATRTPNWYCSTPAWTTVALLISPCPAWWGPPRPRSPSSSRPPATCPTSAGSQCCWSASATPPRRRRRCPRNGAAT